jgi:hypothetical protein
VLDDNAGGERACALDHFDRGDHFVDRPDVFPAVWHRHARLGEQAPTCALEAEMAKRGVHPVDGRLQVLGDGDLARRHVPWLDQHRSVAVQVAQTRDQLRTVEQLVGQAAC